MTFGLAKHKLLSPLIELSQNYFVVFRRRRLEKLPGSSFCLTFPVLKKHGVESIGDRVTSVDVVSSPAAAEAFLVQLVGLGARTVECSKLRFEEPFSLFAIEELDLDDEFVALIGDWTTVYVWDERDTRTRFVLSHLLVS